MAQVYHTTQQLPLFALSRVCCICRIEKSIEDFTKRDYRCKKCNAARAHARRQAKAPIRIIASPGCRICSRCTVEKPLADFPIDRNMPDGHRGTCNACRATEATEERRKRGVPLRRHLTKEIMQKGVRVCTLCGVEKPLDQFNRQSAHNSGYRPACKPCQQNEQHAYVANRSEEVCQAQKEHLKQYYAARPFSHQQRVMRRKARMAQSPSENVSYQAILERDGMWCYICEKPIEPHQKINFDHVYPVVRGGAHVKENIKVTHATCNHRKGKRLLEEMTPFQRRGVE